MVWYWRWDGNGCSYKSSGYPSWHGNHAEQDDRKYHKYFLNVHPTATVLMKLHVGFIPTVFRHVCPSTLLCLLLSTEDLKM